MNSYAGQRRENQTRTRVDHSGTSFRNGTAASVGQPATTLAQRMLGKALNSGPNARSLTQLRQSLDGSPRVVVQAKLAESLQTKSDPLVTQREHRECRECAGEEETATPLQVDSPMTKRVVSQAKPSEPGSDRNNQQPTNGRSGMDAHERLPGLTAASGQPNVIQRLVVPLDRLGPIEEYLARAGTISADRLREMSASQKVDEFSRLAGSDEVGFLRQYLVRHEHLSLAAAGEMDVGQLLERYQLVTQPDSATGLASDASVARMAERVNLNRERWQAAGPGERMLILVARANTELRAEGVPLVNYATRELPPSENAIFDEKKWSIFFNVETFNAASEGYASMNIAEVANTAYHEARHAEQFYRVATLLAGDGLDEGAIIDRTKMPAWVVRKAMQHPLRREHAASPGVQEAVDWEVSLSGDDREQREAAILLLKRLRLEMAELTHAAEKWQMRRLQATHGFAVQKFKFQTLMSLPGQLDALTAKIQEWRKIDRLDLSPEEKGAKWSALADDIEDTGELDAELDAELGLGEDLDEVEMAAYSAADWLQEKTDLLALFNETNAEFEQLKTEHGAQPFRKAMQDSLEIIKEAAAAYDELQSRIAAGEPAREQAYAGYRELPEETDAWAVGARLEETMQLSASSPRSSGERRSSSPRAPLSLQVSGPGVVQLARVDGEVTADTQLVRINRHTIFGGEGGQTVAEGANVVVDDEQKYLSRRAPEYSAEDRSGEHEHRWFRVLNVEFGKVPEGLYIPADRFRPEVSGAAEDLIEQLGTEAANLSLELQQRIIAGVRGTTSFEIGMIADGQIEELATALPTLKEAFARDRDNPRAFATAVKQFVRAIAAYKRRAEAPEKATPTITEKELDRLYEALHEQIVAAKMAAASAEKPLLVLVAEGHYQASSELPKYMILDIIRRLKISNVAMEITPADAEFMAEKVHQSPVENLTEEGRYLDTWFRAVHADGPPIATDVDKEQVRERLSSTVSAEAVEARNAGISRTMQSLPKDALLVVGASHLKGLFEDADLRRVFYVKAISLVDPEQVSANDFFRDESGGELRETSKFLMELPAEIERLMASGVEGLTPAGGFELANETASRFHST